MGKVKKETQDAVEDIKEAEKGGRKGRKKSAKVKEEPQDDAAAASLQHETQAAQHAFDGHKWWVGAHMSAAGGVENSISNARLYGCQAWALFLKPKMQWSCKDLSQDSVDKFAQFLPEYGYADATHVSRILPHGSYLINLGNPDPEKRQKSLESFIDDVTRAARLGIKLYNFHPGSGVGECSKEEACNNIADCINTTHQALQKEKLECPIILLENMAGQGRQVGGKFAELGEVISRVKDKSKVGVCLDTAHVFASGFDIRTRAGFSSMIDDLDEKVGLRYLKGIHLNDSASALGSFKDRHANIGLGQIGLTPFHCIMTDPRFQGMPLVLETPATSWKIWQGEIQALYALSDLPEDPATWKPVLDKLIELSKMEKEMEKGPGSMAEGSKAAKRAAEGKPPKVLKQKAKKADKVEGQAKSKGKGKGKGNNIEEVVKEEEVKAASLKAGTKRTANSSDELTEPKKKATKRKAPTADSTSVPEATSAQTVTEAKQENGDASLAPTKKSRPRRASKAVSAVKDEEAATEIPPVAEPSGDLPDDQRARGKATSGNVRGGRGAGTGRVRVRVRGGSERSATKKS